MNNKIHTINNSKIAEIISDEIIVNNVEEALNLLGSLYYEEVDKIIIYEKNLTPDFFELKTKIAGEILQKFSNYRVRLVIIGDFSKYPGKSIRDFIFESNKGKQIIFVPTIEEALTMLS